MSQTITYRIAGMTCGGCARAVESAIRAAVPSVATVSVDVDAGTVTVDATAPAGTIEGAVDDAGFDFEGLAG